MELQNVNNFNVVGEILDQSSMLSMVELEAIAQSSRRRALASKVIWMSKRFENIESVAEIDRWGKTMNYLCDSMMQAGKVGTDEFNDVKCLKGANVTRDGIEADVLVSLKNTNDLEKSESVHVDVSDAQFESDREQTKRLESSGSEDEVDEVSALSSDGVSKDPEFVNCSSSSESLVDDAQERPGAEDKTSSTPPAIDFHKLSLFASSKPKVHVVPSLPSPFWVKKGGKVGRWRRNSFSAVQDSADAKPKGKKTGGLMGYYSADESCVTKVAAN